MGKVLYALLVLTRANNHHMHLVNCSVSSGPSHETLVQSIYIQPTTNNQRLEPTTSTIKFFNPSKSRNCRSKQRKRESLGKRATSDRRVLPNIKRPSDPSVTHILYTLPTNTMGDLQFLLLIFILDAAAVIIRISSGSWSTSAKLGLLASHLALLNRVLGSMTSQVSA